MKRLTVSLDREVVAELEKLAKAEKVSVAGVARRLMHEAMAYRKQLALQQTMAAAYAAGATDSEEHDTLRSLQGGQDELLAKRGRG